MKGYGSMFIFFNQATLPQPSTWPAGVPWNTNQHEPAGAFFDSTQFQGAARSSFTGTPILVQADETGLANQSVCADIFNHGSDRTDTFGLQKYYCDQNHAVWQRNGWVQAPLTYTPAPATDIQLTFARSAERAMLDDNFATEVAVLDNIVNTAPTTLAQAYVYEQQLARNVKRLLSMFHRFFTPDAP